MIAYTQEVSKLEGTKRDYSVSRFYQTDDHKQQHVRVRAHEIRAIERQIPTSQLVNLSDEDLAIFAAQDELEENERKAGLRE